jgi:hypothetical protein
MPKTKQKDNSTYQQKVMIRQRMLSRMKAAGVEPILMETHGGFGKLYAACYSDIRCGVVFDKDPDKAERLALQRPTWAVYQGDCEQALLHGAGAHLTVTALDVDAYGDSLTPISCWFLSDRPRADKLWIVGNDGMRQNARLGDAWSVDILKPAVAHFGNQLDGIYLQACRWTIEQHAEKAGYKVDHFGGWYTGDKNQVTHYLVELVR